MEFGRRLIATEGVYMDEVGEEKASNTSHCFDPKGTDDMILKVALASTKLLAPMIRHLCTAQDFFR